jgi:PAS domain S-box-containing protein
VAPVRRHGTHGSPDEQPRNPQAGPPPRGRRADLVADAVHELKTPLAIVLGLCSRLLAAPDATADARRDVERIRANTYGMIRRVEEMLSAARLDAGQAPVEVSERDVAALVRHAAEAFGPLAEETGQRLVIEAPASLTARIDEAKLLSVLTNLLANAVRYSPAGGVVRCTLAVRDARLRIEVADSGPGVPPAEREAIFERFHQVPGPVHRRGGQTGLGLAIARDFIEIMGGTVTAGDAPEGGLLQQVELPYEPATDAPASAASLPAGAAEHERATVEALTLELRARNRPRRTATSGAESRRRVLVVERTPSLAAYLEELLGDDFDVHHAVTAAQAHRIAPALGLDAVLVDVDGVEGGGEAALEALAIPALAGVPVVVLTGEVETAQRLVAGGADDYAIKPFAESLLVRLGTLVECRRMASTSAQADQRFRVVFEHAVTPIALVSRGGRILTVNAALRRLVGIRGALPPDLTLDDITVAEGRRPLEAGRLFAGAEHQELHLERRLTAADGRLLRASLAIAPIREGDAVPQLVIRFLDIAPADA